MILTGVHGVSNNFMCLEIHEGGTVWIRIDGILIYIHLKDLCLALLLLEKDVLIERLSLVNL